MKANKILVLGGSGFIGTRLVQRLLKQGHQVRIVDKVTSKKYPQLSYLCDIRDIHTLAKACKGYKIMYNLAAEHRDDVTPRSLYDEVNVGGARHTCIVADKVGINKIIFTSSVAVYGYADKETDEDAVCKPVNDYGRTKLEAELIYRKWFNNSTQKTLIIIRPTVVFGENNRGNVYNLLKQIASGKFLFVGNGKNKKSMAYVKNVADFLIYILDFKPGLKIYNYVDKPDLDMNTLVSYVNQKLSGKKKTNIKIPTFLGDAGGLFFDLLATITGKKLAISSVRIKKFYTSTLFSSREMLATGFKPLYSLKEGLNKMIAADFQEYIRPAT